MDFTTFYSAVVQLAVALVIALAARGFISAKTPLERETEYIEAAGVLAAASVAATVSLGCLLFRYEGLWAAVVAAFGLAIAWGSLISSYFVDARKKLGKRPFVQRRTRPKIVALLSIAVVVPLGGAIGLAVSLPAQQLAQR